MPHPMHPPPLLTLQALRPPLDGQPEPRPWFHLGDVRAEASEGQGDEAKAATKSADVYVFDRIGGWGGVSADDFVRDVAGLDVDHIDLHLNSPGGDAFEGVAIANVLRSHKANVTVWVDGIAASAASVIAMAGDEVVMNVGSQLMIHDASALAWGDAGTMRKASEVLDSVSDSLATTYAAKAGGTAAEWREVMVAETWYTGEEAVTAGLADRMATEDDRGGASGEQITPGGQTSFWDLWDSYGDPQRHANALRALYAYAGRDAAPAPRMPGREAGSKTPAASAGGFTPPQEDDDMSTLNKGLSQRLGIAENADEASILAAVDELKARADAPKLPDGAVPIEKEQLEQLQAAARDGQEAREQQRTEHREQLVSAAVKDGRIAASRREHWLTALKADPEGAEESLKALAPGLIPVAELGHAGDDPADDLGDDALDELAALAGLPKGALRG
jgi:ATP-dependent protease ClpP protease subunit